MGNGEKFFGGLLLCALLVLLCAAVCRGQDLPEAPKPQGRAAFIAAQAGLWGAGIVNAHAAAYGSNQCRLEDTKFHHPQTFGGRGGGHFHPWARGLRMVLPADAAVTILSLLVRRHHPGLALAMPAAGAGAELGAAGVMYGAGCF